MTKRRKRDLSAASRAFAEIADDPSGRRGGSAGGTAQGSKVAKMSAGSATATPKAATSAEPRQSRDDTTGGKSTVRGGRRGGSASRSKTEAGFSRGNWGEPTKTGRRGGFAFRGQWSTPWRCWSCRPSRCWRCYYVLCWATHSGNFLKLPLPFLPPVKETPKAQSLAPHQRSPIGLAESPRPAPGRYEFNARLADSHQIASILPIFIRTLA